MRVLRREKLAMDAKMRQEELAREEEEKKGKKGKVRVLFCQAAATVTTISAAYA